MTFLEAALQILGKERKSLHFKEITEMAVGKKLLTFVGRTPEVTMQTQLTASVKKAPGNPFVRVKPGVFGLLRYPDVVEPEVPPAAVMVPPPAAEKAAKGGGDAASEDADAEARRGRRSRRGRRGGRGEVEETSTQTEPSASTSSGSGGAPTDSDEVSAEDQPKPAAARPSYSRGDRGRPDNRHSAPMSVAPPVEKVGDAAPSVSAENAEGDEDGELGADDGTEIAAGEGQDAGEGEALARRRRRRRRRRRGGADAGGGLQTEQNSPSVPFAADGHAADMGGMGVDESNEGEVSGEGESRSAAPVPASEPLGSSDVAPSADTPNDGQPRRIMAPVDAAIEVLRGQAPGRGVHVRQIADAAVRRRLVHGESHEAWRVIRAALAAEGKERLRAGLRPRVRSAGSGLYALARRPADLDLEKAEYIYGEALRALRERTLASLELRLGELASGAFEALARVILQREGFGPATFVKRVEGTVYVEALRGRGWKPSKCLVGLRWGATPAGRRAVGELRAGVRARNADEGVLILAGRLADEAIREWKQPGPPIEVVDGPAMADACARHGVGVINAPVNVDFVDADFFAELAEG